MWFVFLTFLFFIVFYIYEMVQGALNANITGDHPVENIGDR